MSLSCTRVPIPSHGCRASGRSRKCSTSSGENAIPFHMTSYALPSGRLCALADGIGRRSDSSPPCVTGRTKAFPSVSIVLTIQPMRVCRVPRLHGATSTLRASSSFTRISPLLEFSIRWMVIDAIMSEMRHTAAATSGASDNLEYPLGQMTPGESSVRPTTEADRFFVCLPKIIFQLLFWEIKNAPRPRK